MLWAVANTLTVFAIRDVGLSVAFRSGTPTALSGCSGAGCCSTSCAGRDARANQGARRAAAIVVGACLTGLATSHRRLAVRTRHGDCAAVTAGMLWGTMYIPYRKAYISG